MSTRSAIPIYDQDPDEQSAIYESQAGMYELCPPAELLEYAGLPEHPDETERRLIVAGDWDGPGGALEHFGLELARNLASGDALRRKNARRQAYEDVQRVPRWQPPADAISVPTVFELRQRERGQQGGELASEDEGLGSAAGYRPPKLTEEERQHFRNIDHEMALGRTHCAPLEDLHWVYLRLDDEDVTALDAPSRGAWTQLHMARFNRMELFKSTWPGAVGELVKRQPHGKFKDPAGSMLQSHDEVKAMISAAVAESQKAIELWGP